VGTSLAFGPVERSFRLIFEELPPLETSDRSRSNVRVLTEMGIPIFLEPEKVAQRANLEDVALEDGFLSFSFRNSGNVHTMIRSVRLNGVGNSGEQLFQQNESGWYVLGGGARDYRFKLPAGTCGRLKELLVEVDTENGTSSEKLAPSSDGCRSSRE
jgi:P pilus assembly chaperone PapD